MRRFLSGKTIGIAVLAGTALLSLACGEGHGREKEESEARKVAQQADQTHALDARRAVGEMTSITGCLQKNGHDFVLRKNDTPVTAGPTGTTGTGDDRDTTYISKPAEAPSYVLHAKDGQLDNYVNKEIRISGSLADTADPGGVKDRNLAEVNVTSAALVAENCSTAGVKN
jgi:hypothetical protein